MGRFPFLRRELQDAEYQLRRSQLETDRTIGRIDEPEFHRRMEELERFRSSEDLPRSSETLASRGSSEVAKLSGYDDSGVTLDAGSRAAGSSAEMSTLRQNLPPRASSSTSMKSGGVLGSYKLIDPIGRGAFGEVWKAFSEFEDRHVALKVLPDELSRDLDEMGRVRKCFNRIHHLQHEHICPMYGLAHDPVHGFYLVMKFVDGVPLNRWRESPGEAGRPVEQSLDLLMMAARALDYAHRHKVVHRDIKPANMLVAVDGTDLQVVDFGLAEQIHSSMSRISTGSAMVGTPAYMSPEACRGLSQTGASDQYSLGCVAYYLFSARPPFVGSPMIVINCHRQESPQPIESISAAANEILRRGLSKEPGERFASCAEFIDALHRSVFAPTATFDMAAPTPRAVTVQARPISSSGSSSSRFTGTSSLAPCWTTATGADTDARPMAIEFARNSEQLVAVYRDGAITSWSREYQDGKQVRPVLPDPLVDAGFTAQGGFLVVAGTDKLAAVDVVSGRIVSTAQLPSAGLISISTTGSARQIFCLADGQRILVVDLVTGKLTRSSQTWRANASCLRLSYRGDLIAEGGREGLLVGPAGGVQVASAKKMFEKRGSIPTSVRFSADDRIVAARFDDGTIGVCDVRTAKSLSIQRPGVQLATFAFSPTADRLYATADDACLRSFSTSSGVMKNEFPLPAVADQVAVSHQSRVAVALNNGQVLVAEDLRSEESQTSMNRPFGQRL